VTATTGETHTAAAWVRANGRARVLRGAMVTADRYAVGTVVCVQDPDMKQAWCLAASSTNATAKQLLKLHPPDVALVMILQQNLPLLKRLSMAVALADTTIDDLGALLTFAVDVGARIERVL